MRIHDSIFGELEYDYVWSKNITIDYFGSETEIPLVIKGDEDGKFDEGQYLAYQALIKKWEQLQYSFIQPILHYYERKRHELGYDTKCSESYPQIVTSDQLLKNIYLDGIIVPYGDIREGRDIGILFNCIWDQENGLGIRLLNEEVVEVGYQDIVI